jgi:hypothetical protein
MLTSPSLLKKNIFLNFCIIEVCKFTPGFYCFKNSKYQFNKNNFQPAFCNEFIS